MNAALGCFALLVCLCSSIFAEDLDAIFRRNERRATAQMEKWLRSRPPFPVKKEYQRFFQLLETSAFGDFTEEAERLYQRAAQNPRGNKPLPRVRHVKKLRVFEELKKGGSEVDKFIYTTWQMSRHFFESKSWDFGDSWGSWSSWSSSSSWSSWSSWRSKRQAENTLSPEEISDALSRELDLNGAAVTDRPVRMEYRCMSDSQRQKYHAAVQGLKNSVVNDTNAFDLFSAIHNVQTARGAHFGPAFGAWHRYYLWLYEEALQQIDPEVTLPYWDNSFDATLANPLSSSLWKNDYLGSPSGEVTSQDFGTWRTANNDILRRNVRGDTSLLYSSSIIDSILSRSNLQSMYQDFENAHGGVHVYVAGHMAGLNTAAMDPLFYMHHAFVDCLWEEWRERNQYPGNTEETDYPSDASLQFLPAHHYNASMEPFGIPNNYGLKKAFTNIYYRCQPRNTCPNNYCGADGYGGPNCIPRPAEVSSTTTTTTTTTTSPPTTSSTNPPTTSTTNPPTTSTTNPPTTSTTNPPTTSTTNPPTTSTTNPPTTSTTNPPTTSTTNPPTSSTTNPPTTSTTNPPTTSATTRSTTTTTESNAVECHDSMMFTPEGETTPMCGCNVNGNWYATGKFKTETPNKCDDCTCETTLTYWRYYCDGCEVAVNTASHSTYSTQATTTPTTTMPAGSNTVECHDSMLFTPEGDSTARCGCNVDGSWYATGKFKTETPNKCDDCTCETTLTYWRSSCNGCEV